TPLQGLRAGVPRVTLEDSLTLGFLLPRWGIDRDYSSSSPRMTREEINDLMNPDRGDFGRSAACASASAYRSLFSFTASTARMKYSDVGRSFTRLALS